MGHWKTEWQGCATVSFCFATDSGRATVKKITVLKSVSAAACVSPSFTPSSVSTDMEKAETSEVMAMILYICITVANVDRDDLGARRKDCRAEWVAHAAGCP